jgi:hypothetical protein
MYMLGLNIIRVTGLTMLNSHTHTHTRTPWNCDSRQLGSKVHWSFPFKYTNHGEHTYVTQANWIVSRTRTHTPKRLHVFTMHVGASPWVSDMCMCRGYLNDQADRLAFWPKPIQGRASCKYKGVCTVCVRIVHVRHTHTHTHTCTHANTQWRIYIHIHSHTPNTPSAKLGIFNIGVGVQKGL